MDTFDWDAWWPGGVVLGVLAALFLWVRHKTRDPGFGFFALALAIGSAIFLVKNPLMPDFGGTSIVGLGMAGAAGIAMATGMCLYTSNKVAAWRDAMRLAAVWIVATIALHILSVGRPLTAHISLGLLMIWLAVMGLRARQQAPGTGFGFVSAAFLVQPLVVLVGWLTAQPEFRVRLWTWVPFGIAGATLLSVGQMRSHTALAKELRRRETAEALLRDANESLEQRVAERTADLSDMIEGLESFNRTVSHDLRGPLGGIKGLADLAIDLVREGHDDRAIELLRAISRQGQSSIDLIAALMEFAQARRAPLNLLRVDLDAIVREAVETVSLSRPEAARVAWRIEPLPPLPAGDRSLLRQAFVNLIGNAVKFSSGSEFPWVSVAVSQDGAILRIEVCDNGVGFDSSTAELFQPFRRLHGALFDGTGIGLSIVRNIVSRHGGEVGCRSELGAGACFWVSLDLTTIAPNAPG